MITVIIIHTNLHFVNTFFKIFSKIFQKAAFYNIYYRNTKSYLNFWRVILNREHAGSFACGEFYCFAVIFAMRVLGANRISLKPQASISLLRSKNITLCVSKEYHSYKAEKRESYRIFLPYDSLFCFYCRFRICITNAVGLCPYPYSISPLRISPISLR